ncbi:MAG: hypothetical protein ABSH56_34525 [Bryobacteraceae bacterium]|jgi:hypothetical protein
MKTKLMALMLLAGSAAFAGPRFYFGVGVPAPVVAYRPPVVAYAPPVAPVYPAYGPAYVAPYPGPGFVWTAGFYGPGRVWHAGYWARPYGFAGPRVVGRGYGYRGGWRR